MIGLFFSLFFIPHDFVDLQTPRHKNPSLLSDRHIFGVEQRFFVWIRDARNQLQVSMNFLEV